MGRRRKEKKIVLFVKVCFADRGISCASVVSGVVLSLVGRVIHLYK